MKNVRSSVWYGFAGIAAVCACSAANGAEAKNLIFTNAQGNGYWEEQTVNWADIDTSDSSAYVDSANAYIYEGSWQSEGDLNLIIKKLKKNAQGKDDTFQFALGNTVISNDNAKVIWTADGNSYYNYHTGSGNHGKSGGVTKLGTGALDIHFHNQFNGDFICRGGTVATFTGSSHPGDYRSMLGSLIYSGRKVVFAPDEGLPNTKLVFYASDPLGGPTAGGAVSYFFTNTSIQVDINDKARVSFGKTVFCNSTFEPFKACHIYFANDLTITGSASEPVELTTESTCADATLFTFGKNGAFMNLRVDDITGDDSVDFRISGRLDSDPFLYTKANRYFPYAFKKTGSGTMEIYHGRNSFTWSTATNVYWYAGGKVIYNDPDGMEWGANNSSILGRMDNPSNGSHVSIIVSDGAEIYFPQSRPMGMFNQPMSWELSVSNSTLRIGDKTFQHFGTLRLHNANLAWENAYQNTWINYDFIGCSDKLVLSGDTPYNFQPKGLHPTGARSDNCTFRLGFTYANCVKDTKPVVTPKPDYYGDMFTNMWSVVDIEVEDITKSEAVDATMGWTIKDMPNVSYDTYTEVIGKVWSGNKWKNWRFHGGIRKTGKGTFRSEGKNTYTHTTEVAEGALLVDNTIASSSGATVDAGAYLGGTGTVCAVTVKNNGGFIVDAAKDQEAVLKIPSLTVEGTVVVKVTDVTSLGVRDFDMPLLKLENKPQELDLTNWKVQCSGCKSLKASYDAESGIVSVRSSGMIILLK